MINKFFASPEAALADLPDGATVMIGGSRRPLGQPHLPHDGARCVNRVYTDLAVIDVKPDGLHLVEIVADISFEELQRLNGVPLKVRAAA